jgi:hypothetical protein
VQKRGTILILLLGLCLVVYWPLLKYPYVQDDWGVLTLLLRGENRSVLASEFLPQGQLMYRPLPWLYFAPMVHFLGANAFLHHLLALVLHCCTSFLVFLTIRQLGQKEPIPAITALIYLAAASIHMDPLIWLVGTYDLTAAFFFFLSLFLFLQGRSALSALGFFFGVLCKESILPLPLIFALILLLARRSTPGEIARLLWPHFLVLVLYSIFRFWSSTAILPDARTPYSMEFSLSHAMANLLIYLRWLAEAGISLHGHPPFTSLVVVTALLLLTISGIPLLFRRMPQGEGPVAGRELLLWPAWIIAGLLPVLLLTDHAYRYYLTYSLVPAIILFLWIIARILRLFGASWRAERRGLFCYALLVCGLSALFLHSRDADRWNERQLEGTNRLIGKASGVAQVQNYMRENREELRRYSVLFLDGVDGSQFGDSLGPRLWLESPMVRVFPSSWVTASGETLIVEGSENPFAIRASEVQILEAELEGGNWTGRIIRRSLP